MQFGKKTGLAHEWVESQLGHGDLMCKRCMITSAEARVLGLVNDCQVARGEHLVDNAQKDG
jgi:hypothetical protein